MGRVYNQEQAKFVRDRLIQETFGVGTRFIEF